MGLNVSELIDVLLDHVLSGRGGDDVYVVLADAALPDDVVHQLAQRDWAVESVRWTGDDDHYLTLRAEPEERA